TAVVDQAREPEVEAFRDLGAPPQCPHSGTNRKRPQPQYLTVGSSKADTTSRVSPSKDMHSAPRLGQTMAGVPGPRRYPVGCQVTSTRTASASPGQGGMVAPITMRGSGLSQRNWKCVPVGILSDRPGPSSVTSSSSPSLRQMRPRPEITYQSSSTVW